MSLCDCGWELAPGARFCGRCGRQVAALDQADAAPDETPEPAATEALWRQPAWAGPRDLSGPPSTRHRRLPVVVITSLFLLAVGISAFGISVHYASVSGSSLAQYRPEPLATPVPSATPLPLSDVAARSLGDVVTVQSQTDQGEEFGTGWLLDKKGDFVTNYHVIEKGHSLRILDRRNTVHDGVVMGFSAQDDVAVIRALDGFAGEPLVIGPGSDPPVEEQVIVLASARATQQSDQTIEVLVRLHQPIPVQNGSDLGTQNSQVVYSDMMVLRGNKIYRGNSGGPVLDQFNRVIGIVTLASQSAPQAFAIPIGRVLDELRAFAARPTPGG
ncbi:MAG TPA: trypsin-like peptidase domain-containing protein [Candidatus Dormibacteraeota bacterium]|nr:trypsin-like peptidase domain-containing protein [Candidatus Dormibacteraeota bacterium]